MVGQSYAPQSNPLDALAARDRGVISVYAKGRDYHDVLKTKIKALARAFAAASGADVKVFVEDVFVSADGSRVVGRYRYEGTHTGNFLGYPATGNAFAMRSIDIWRVENGRFVEHWDELNTLDVFIQVGAVPPPRQPAP